MLSELLVAGSVLLVLLAIVTVASLSAAAERFERRMQRAYQEGYEAADGHFGANLYAKADQPKLYERFEAGQRMGRHRKNWEEAEASAVSADAKAGAEALKATETARHVQEAKDAVAAASELVDLAAEERQRLIDDIRRAYAEIDRLRRGEFTEDEAHVLCRDFTSACTLLNALTKTSCGERWLLMRRQDSAAICLRSVLRDIQTRAERVEKSLARFKME